MQVQDQILLLLETQCFVHHGFFWYYFKFGGVHLNLGPEASVPLALPGRSTGQGSSFGWCAPTPTPQQDRTVASLPGAPQGDYAWNPVPTVGVVGERSPCRRAWPHPKVTPV